MQWDESANICNDYKLSAPPENLDLIWTQDSRSGLSRVVTQEHGNAGPCISLRQLPCLFLLRKRADDQHAFCFVASLVQVDPAVVGQVFPIAPPEQCGALLSQLQTFPVEVEDTVGICLFPLCIHVRVIRIDRKPGLRFRKACVFFAVPLHGSPGGIPG